MIVLLNNADENVIKLSNIPAVTNKVPRETTEQRITIDDGSRREVVPQMIKVTNVKVVIKPTGSYRIAKSFAEKLPVGGQHGIPYVTKSEME
jgi:hypothetical protein